MICYRELIPSHYKITAVGSLRVSRWQRMEAQYIGGGIQSELLICYALYEFVIVWRRRMNILQLRYLSEALRQDFNISQVARVLHTSQPGVSVQLRRLERELGMEIFLRERNRLVGLTPMGKSVVDGAERALREIDIIYDLAESNQQDSSGILSIVTTHAQARYRLPAMLQRFGAVYPNVKPVVQLASARPLAEQLALGKADLGLFSDVQPLPEEIVRLPIRSQQRMLLTSPGHPLLRMKKPKLVDLAKYPLILGQYLPNVETILQQFELNSLTPQTIKLANTDVIKAYVEKNMGVAIIAEFTFDAKRDKGLRVRSLTHLFPPTTTYLLLNRKHLLKRYVYEFIQYMSPDLTREVIENALANQVKA